MEINYLRISVTDRCNLRCLYCFPKDYLPRGGILSFEEIRFIAESLGIKNIRLTGGEPLVRKDFPKLVKMLSPLAEDLSLTTNGVLLKDMAYELKKSGIKRVNISLNSLKRDNYRRITGEDRLSDAMRGIEEALRAGFSPVKINVVLLKGINEDEIMELAYLARDGLNVRFIELMPFLRDDLFLPTDEAERRIREAFGELEPSELYGFGPARYYTVKGWKGKIGFISPITHKFCRYCNRIRLTSDGKIKPCLLSDIEIDIRGKGREEIREVLKIAPFLKGGRGTRRRMVEIGG